MDSETSSETETQTETDGQASVPPADAATPASGAALPAGAAVEDPAGAQAGAQAGEPGDAPAGTRPGLARLLGQDLRRVALISLFACVTLGLFEYASALLTSPAHDIRVVTAVRLLFLDLSLVALLWLVVGPLLCLAAVGARLALAAHAPDRARTWRGLLAPPPEGFQAAASWLWATFLAALVYLTAASYITYRAVTWFKEQQLTALLLSLGQLVLIAFLASAGYAVGLLLRIVGLWLHRRLGTGLARFSPLGRVGPALIAMLVCTLPVLWVAVLIMPQLEPLIPWRLLLGLAVFGGGIYSAAVLAGRPGPWRRWKVSWRRSAAGAGVALVLLMLTLTRIGAEPEAKSVAITGSPLLAGLVDAVRKVNDFDRDGYGSLLGENDCAPFDREIHPLARDLADNGIDEDCNGRDFSFALPPSYKTGEKLPVPEDFRRDWNILLLTVDTVRYDHTGFGGYIATKGRDTTPELDKLVERSVSFTFANAPSAGTMASVPAILTSKFFHSGIALDENVKPRSPPKLMPQNLLISEVMKERGYYNGAILTHDYFNDWGMEQGFDTYDNDLGKKREPAKITSHDVTDKAIAWIAGNGDRKWFLWAHYIDPHGYYVEHPGERSFGTTEEDRYDGELYYTDKHIGRLLKSLATMPGADRTVVIITSDHGDAFNEHGFINHGQALHRELLHVPLIVHIPGVPPRTVDGAVSPLDILPTVADLVGAPYDPAQFEGESLVPQLFYGKDAHHRVVFSETNYTKPQRAAITSSHKLIYKLQGNIYELYDLKEDPWEKRNIATRDAKAFQTMKRYLDDWLERVYYARDVVSNQTAAKLKEYLLASAPTPQHPVQGISFDDGRIEVLGYDLDKDSYQGGEPVKLAVYFRVKERPSNSFFLQAEAWQPAQAPATVITRSAHSRRQLTAEGTFPTSRWREGEYIRDRFTITLPRGWRTGDRLVLGLTMSPDRGAPLTPAGPHKPDASHVALLGEVPYRPEPASSPETPGKPGVSPATPPASPGKAPASPASPGQAQPSPGRPAVPPRQ